MTMMKHMVQITVVILIILSRDHCSFLIMLFSVFYFPVVVVLLKWFVCGVAAPANQREGGGEGSERDGARRGLQIQRRQTIPTPPLRPLSARTRTTNQLVLARGLYQTPSVERRIVLPFMICSVLVVWEQQQHQTSDDRASARARAHARTHARR